MQTSTFYIAVCDDELHDREYVADMTQRACSFEQIQAQIACFSSAAELLQQMREGKHFQMFLIDVLMPEQDGMEFARRIQKEKPDIPLVFFSNNKEMALRGYEVSAVRYLAKPVEMDRLREAVRFCYDLRQKNTELIFPVNTGMKKVLPKDIYYVEISGRKLRIVQEKEEWETSLTLGRLEAMLEGRGFVRCHRSYLVNCHHVRMLRTSSLELTDKTQIPVSKYKIKEVRRLFSEYMAN